MWRGSSNVTRMSTQMCPHPEIVAPWAAAREESRDSTWGRKGQELSRDAVKTQKRSRSQGVNMAPTSGGIKDP